MTIIAHRRTLNTVAIARTGGRFAFEATATRNMCLNACDPRTGRGVSLFLSWGPSRSAVLFAANRYGFSFHRIAGERSFWRARSWSGRRIGGSK